MTKHEMNRHQGHQPMKHEETGPPGRLLAPAVDILESIESLTLVADMPGVTKESLEINMEKNVLTINGTVAIADRGRPILREFSLANDYRQFKLPDQVDTDKALPT